ncbi:MurR/RpiR family transcriptional regulator [Alteromonas sp. 14N.309.X.WAT.G.H12]|uniref:MurR/RpiR family transcriptional regulator n=1 Tax=Alteromonas sp. 14N.309.X.WAT.G.H12 TaxID=3120824 RepID=UPI002FD66C4F
MAMRNDLLGLIEQHYPSLPPSARQIANYLQQHPIAIVSQSTAEIAKTTHTSKATVSRFFRQLGFTSHQDAKDTILAMREKGLPVALDDQEVDHFQKELRNMSLTYEGLKTSAVNDVVELLAHSERITLIGYRNAYPLALHFRQQLKQVRSTVRLLPQPGQTLGEDLVDIPSNEVVVLLGFRRRTKLFKRIISVLQNHTTILITDPTGQIYNQKVDHLLVCHPGQTLAFDSYAAPMSLISFLANKVFERLGDKAANRAAYISKMYDDLEELEP